MKVTEMSREELLVLESELQVKYDAYKAKGLKLDMSRGKPSSLQLDINNEMLAMPLDSYILDNGLDVRNYGGVDGTVEM